MLIIRLGKVKPKSRPLRFRGFRAKYFSFRGRTMTVLTRRAPVLDCLIMLRSDERSLLYCPRARCVRRTAAIDVTAATTAAAAAAAATAAVAIFIRFRRRIRCYFFSEYLRNYLTDSDAVFTAGKGMKGRIWRNKGLSFI